jgi:hypothetical protein
MERPSHTARVRRAIRTSSAARFPLTEGSFSDITAGRRHADRASAEASAESDGPVAIDSHRQRRLGSVLAGEEIAGAEQKSRTANALCPTPGA